MPHWGLPVKFFFAFCWKPFQETTRKSSISLFNMYLTLHAEHANTLLVSPFTAQKKNFIAFCMFQTCLLLLHTQMLGNKEMIVYVTHF